jgi:putative transposase
MPDDALGTRAVGRLQGLDDRPAMESAVRKVTYQLYPSQTQLAQLDNLLRHHQQLYNACLEPRIDAYRRCGLTRSYEDQCRDLTDLRRECPEWAGINCSSQQVTLRRLDKAFKASFARLKARNGRAGFPRFKSLDRFPGVGFKSHGDGWRFVPCADWRHGKLRLQGIGVIKARGIARNREQVTIKSCELMNQQGQWFLSLTVECGRIERDGGTQACGFDWGVESFLTLAVATPEGDRHETVENPRWFQQERDRLTVLQQAVSRKKPRSNRRRKGVRRLARAKAWTARRRTDWQHKLSARMVGRFALIATESLSIRNLTRSAAGTAEEPGRNVAQKAGLNREILDTAPAQYLSYV